MSNDFDVLINGGGPVGMGLAIELGQRGINVCVVEKHPKPQQVPKGQNLTQRTCEHFRSWGCEDNLHNAHDIPKGGGIGGMTCYGTLLTDHHYDWLNRVHVKDFYFAPNARLPQYATEQVLRDRAAEIAEIDLRYGWTGTAVEQTDDGVTLTIRNGDETDAVRGKYIVGCDGSRSMVRGAAGISETRSDHDRLMALVVFTSEELHELLKRYPGKAFYNVLHPKYEGYWQFFGRVDHGLSWFFHAPVPVGTTKDNFDFRTLIHSAAGQPFDLSFDYVGFWDLRIALADSYRANRAFVAGDAAHSHPPYGGYGINTGFEDARNLGWKLAAVLQGWAEPALLDTYGEERRPVFASTAKDFIERYIEDDRQFLETYAPDKDAEAFNKAWHSRNLDADEVNSFEPNYEGASTLTGSGPGTPSAHGNHKVEARAGHHLSPPDPQVAQEVSASIGAWFTLFCVDANGVDAAGFTAAATALQVPLKIVEMPRDWAMAWKADLVLVRPDTYVGWAGVSGQKARDILDRTIGQ